MGVHDRKTMQKDVCRWLVTGSESDFCRGSSSSIMITGADKFEDTGIPEFRVQVLRQMSASKFTFCKLFLTYNIMALS